MLALPATDAQITQQGEGLCPRQWQKASQHRRNPFQTDPLDCACFAEVCARVSQSLCLVIMYACERHSAVFVSRFSSFVSDCVACTETFVALSCLRCCFFWLSENNMFWGSGELVPGISRLSSFSEVSGKGSRQPSVLMALLKGLS